MPRLSDDEAMLRPSDDHAIEHFRSRGHPMLSGDHADAVLEAIQAEIQKYPRGRWLLFINDGVPQAVFEKLWPVFQAEGYWPSLGFTSCGTEAAGNWLSVPHFTLTRRDDMKVTS